MTFHIVGFTEREFFDSVGIVSDRVMSILQAASLRTLQAVARDRASYPAKTELEVRSLAAFDSGGLPVEFKDYMELFYFNNPAFELCRAAGMPLKVIGTTATPPENSGVLLRLPFYFHANADAISPKE